MSDGMNDSIERLVHLLVGRDERISRQVRNEVQGWVRETMGLKDLLVDSEGNVIADSQSNFVKAVQ